MTTILRRPEALLAGTAALPRKPTLLLPPEAIEAASPLGFPAWRMSRLKTDTCTLFRYTPSWVKAVVGTSPAAA